jgi:hypothetical protein
MRLVEDYAYIGGEHHKQWLIDQMVRVILGEDGYRQWRLDNGETYDDWDEGIAP